MKKISHKDAYGKAIVFKDDFLVINRLINRKVIENYLLLLGSVYYKWKWLRSRLAGYAAPGAA